MIDAPNISQHFQQMSLHDSSISEVCVYNSQVLSVDWDECHLSLVLDKDRRLVHVPCDPNLGYQHYTSVLNAITVLLIEHGESIPEHLMRMRALPEEHLGDVLYKATALRGLQERFQHILNVLRDKVKKIERAASPLSMHRASFQYDVIEAEKELYLMAQSQFTHYMNHYSGAIVLDELRDLLAPKTDQDRSLASIGLRHIRRTEQELYIGRWFKHPVCRGELHVALQMGDANIDSRFQFKYLSEHGTAFLFKVAPFWSEQVDFLYDKLRSKEKVSQVDFGLDYVSRCFNGKAYYHPSSCHFSFKLYSPNAENTAATLDFYHFMIEWGVQTGMDVLYLSSILPYAPLHEALGFKMVETSNHSFSHQERGAISSVASTMIEEGVLRSTSGLVAASDPYSYHRLFRFDVATVSDPLPFFQGQSWSDRLRKPILQQPVAKEWPSLSAVPIGLPLLSLMQLRQRELGLRPRAQLHFEREEVQSTDSIDAFAERGSLVSMQKNGETQGYLLRFKRL